MTDMERARPRASAPSRTPSRRIFAIAALIALVVVLLLLVPNLRNVPLEPGEDLGLIGTSGEVETGEIPSLESWGSDGIVILMRIVIWVMLAAVALLVIGSLFDRRLRPMLFFLVGIFVVCQLAVTLCSGPAEEVGDPVPREMSGGEWGDLAPYDPGTEMPPAPPAATSTLLLIAILLSVAVTGLGLVLYVKVIRPRRQTPPLPESDGLDELVAQIEETVDRIRLGADAKEAVLACYAEMVRILSRKQSLSHSHLTPREFARALRRAGLASTHVDRLTEIFEVVRYGHRDDATLATRAMESLESIRAAYATEEP